MKFDDLYKKLILETLSPEHPEHYTIVNRHIDLIKVGDLVLCKDNQIRTISPENIKYGGIGTSIFGDSYRAGMDPVKVVIPRRFYKDKRIQ
jgi:hypothetical protein